MKLTFELVKADVEQAVAEYVSQRFECAPTLLTVEINANRYSSEPYCSVTCEIVPLAEPVEEGAPE